MATPKEDLVRLLQQQPDDSSHEELVRELAFNVMIARGLADSDARRVVPDDEVAHRIRQWRKQPGPRRYRYVTDREVRILHYSHFRIAYVIHAETGDIDVPGVFHGALPIERYLI